MLIEVALRMREQCNIARYTQYATRRVRRGQTGGRENRLPANGQVGPMVKRI